MGVGVEAYPPVYLFSLHIQLLASCVILPPLYILYNYTPPCREVSIWIRFTIPSRPTIPAMTNQQVSPISQMLYTLGLTREDLSRRSDEMRQFLTSQRSPTLRVANRDRARRSSSSSDLRPPSRCIDSRSSFARSTSSSCSVSLREPSPPTTPVKTEPHDNTATLRQYDSMDVVIERQRRQSRRGKRARRDKERELAIRSNLPHPTSPSPSIASHASLNLDSFMHSRDDRCVSSADSQDNHNNQVSRGSSTHPF